MAVVDRAIDKWFADNQTDKKAMQEMWGPRPNCANPRTFTAVTTLVPGVNQNVFAGMTDEEKTPKNPGAIVPHYRARPLDGVWATAPYLHNGTVPTLHELLDSSSRPARFTRPPSTDFSHYDTNHVGWKFAEVSREDQASTTKRSPFQAKFIVDTSRFGMGNQGHTFGDALTEKERMDVIEYLKTL